MNGLSSSEVLRSREMHGSNKLPEPKMKKWYDFAKEALSEKITMILIAIAVLQLFLGFMGVMELSDPIMILMVLAIVTVIAVKTGLGVQKSAAELRAKTSVRYCDVIRDGKVQTINKDELVVGDLVCVGMGQEIFADGYIVDGKISVNNAAINGETQECKKTPIQGYIHAKTTSTSAYTNPNCLFAGTTVMSGEGKMIVTDVGVNTVNGDTMVKMQTLESPKTALDIALDNLSDFISKWGTVAAVVTFAVLTMTGIMSVVNIIMVCVNSLSFGGEPPKEEYMSERPIKKGSGLFIRGAKKRIAISTATFIALYGIITFSPVSNMFATDVEAMTARFALLCFMAVFNGFNIRTEHMNLFKGIGKNKLFSYIAVGICAMTVILCDFAGTLIKATALDLNHWLVIIALAFMVIPVDLIRKAVDNRK